MTPDEIREVAELGFRKGSQMYDVLNACADLLEAVSELDDGWLKTQTPLIASSVKAIEDL